MRGWIAMPGDCKGLWPREPHTVYPTESAAAAAAQALKDDFVDAPGHFEIDLSSHPDIQAIHGLLAQLEIALDRHNMGRTPYTIIAKIRRKIT